MPYSIFPLILRQTRKIVCESFWNRSNLQFILDDVIRLHAASRDWLAAILLSEPFAGKTVVITYHAPSSQSVHPRYARDLLTPVFVSNLENLMDGVRVACNLREYTQWMP